MLNDKTNNPLLNHIFYQIIVRAVINKLNSEYDITT